MSTRTGRTALHVYLDDEDYDTWVEASEELGVSISGLVAAITGHLDDLISLDELATVARHVDNTRRRRRRRT